VTMLTKRSAAIYLVAVFLAGLLAGGVAGFSLGKRNAFAPPRPQDMASHICERLKSKLHLTPEQVKQIDPLVNESAAELEAVHSTTADRITEIFQKLNQRQAQYLTPEQKVLLEEMERERQQFFRKAFKARPGRPQPGPAPAANTN
jgi:hypothetical protein